MLPARFGPGACQTIVQTRQGFDFEADRLIVCDVFEIDQNGFFLKIDIIQGIDQTLSTDILALEKIVIICMLDIELRKLVHVFHLFLSIRSDSGSNHDQRIHSALSKKYPLRCR